MKLYNNEPLFAVDTEVQIGDVKVKGYLYLVHPLKTRAIAEARIKTELSHHFVRASERIMRRHGRNTARVAVAREMLMKVIYYILRDRRPFLKEE
jgi:hypothetical protein